MSLSINNPYALSEQEADQMKAWEAMSDDDKGEFLHRAKQEDSNRRYIASKAQADYINSNTVQYLSNGQAQVGGALRTDAIINVDGVEMTVQQAVDLGVRSAESIGSQTGGMQ